MIPQEADQTHIEYGFPVQSFAPSAIACFLLEEPAAHFAVPPQRQHLWPCGLWTLTFRVPRARGQCWDRESVLGIWSLAALTNALTVWSRIQDIWTVCSDYHRCVQVHCWFCPSLLLLVRQWTRSRLWFIKAKNTDYSRLSRDLLERKAGNDDSCRRLV